MLQSTCSERRTFGNLNYIKERQFMNQVSCTDLDGNGNTNSVNEELENILILSINKENISKKRESSKIALENQAKKMK